MEALTGEEKALLLVLLLLLLLASGSCVGGWFEARASKGDLLGRAVDENIGVLLQRANGLQR